MTSMAKIADAVEEAGGFLKIKMVDIREAHGTHKKLGRNVVRDIHAELAAAGLGHCGHAGADLPTCQDASIWVYSQSAPVADLISAIQCSSTAEAMIRTIRELVAPDPR